MTNTKLNETIETNETDFRACLRQQCVEQTEAYETMLAEIYNGEYMQVRARISQSEKEAIENWKNTLWV